MAKRAKNFSNQTAEQLALHLRDDLKLRHKAVVIDKVLDELKAIE